MSNAQIVALFGLLAALSFDIARSRTYAAEHVKVELRLIAVRARSPLNNPPARVRAELWNNGDQDFIAGRELLPILNSPTYLLLDFEDANGKSLDGFSMFVEHVSEHVNWTRIAPYHYYGTEMDLDSKTFPFLDKAGRYTLTAKYVSKGGNTPPSPEWGVPSFKVWEGEILSNPVTIEILPAKSGSQPKK